MTTNHATSSYNQPVFVANGQAYGPSDVPTGTKSTAAQLVGFALNSDRIKGDEAIKAACQFASLSPKTVQDADGAEPPYTIYE